ncbi:MAG: hypothetical protein EU532_04990 [Promethearchaeota archaeon]|nr:MAG: hypothetical protein EU532_04990 [Candidatus Lokiarchaeota archaeon]
MDEFLKQLQLSEEAIKIYRNCLGNPPLTYYEIYSLVPHLSPEDFNNTLKELTETDLLIQLVPQKPEILLYYLAIPPFTPILNYYSNIHTNLANIQDAVMGLFSNSLNQIFKESNHLELDSLHQNFEEVKKDRMEDSLIQKQDAKEILKEFETVQSKLKKNVYNFKLEQSHLNDKIIEITQSQFSDLIGNFSRIKTKLINNIKELELKKKETVVLEVIENIFKDEIRKLLEDFVLTTDNLIEIEYKNFEESINKEKIEQLNYLIDKVIQSGNDFNLIFLTALSNMEKDFNHILKIIKDDKEKLLKNLKKLEGLILKNVTDILKDSMNQVSGLSKPIENIMNQFLELNLTSYKEGMDQIWTVSSTFSLSEAIINLLSKSKKEIIIVIPKIEDYLKLDQFQNLPETLKIKLVSSEPHTNSLVKSLKEINNIEFRTLKNENIIAVKADENYISINVLNMDSKDTLNNVIGIGTNFQPLNRILSPIIETTWSAAEPDFAPAIRKTAPIPTPIDKKIAPPEKIISTPPIKQQIKSEIQQITTEQAPPITQQTIPPKEKSISLEDTKSDIPVQISGSFVSKFSPKAGDSAGMLINTSFNMLISKLDTITGEEFSKELQTISDLILEKKGFSVTLHQVRSIINKYKELDSRLTNENKNEIFESIESWKQRLF